MSASVPTVAPSPWPSLGRAGLRFLAFLLLLLLIRLAWGWYTAHELSAKVESYRRKGEPTRMDEFVLPALPAGQDAYAAAASEIEGLKLTAAETDVVESPNRYQAPRLPLSEADIAVARQMIADHAPLLEALRRARMIPEARWPYNPRDSRMGSWRRAMNFARIVALTYHQDRREDLAMETIMDMLRAGDIVDSGPLIINHLVAVAMTALTTNTVMDIAVDLRVQSAVDTGGARPQQISDLIAALLNERSGAVHQITALKWERAYVAIGGIDEHERGWWMHPLFEADVRRYLRIMDANIAAADEATWPEAKAHFPPSSYPSIATASFADLEYYALTRPYSRDEGFNRALLIHERTMLTNHVTVLRLALRLYELDHQGQLPRLLAQLVPEYLAKVPADPFRDDNGPLSYDARRRLVYSVDENGVDDGAPTPPGVHLPQWGGKDDLVFPLDREAPAAAPEGEVPAAAADQEPKLPTTNATNPTQ